MNDDPVRALAQAVLYEGYVLWPYRRSAVKNRKRWTFGGVYPRAWSEHDHPDDPWSMAAECVVELSAPQATIDVNVRFLHVVARRLARIGDHGLEDTGALEVDGESLVPWDEAVERDVALTDVTVPGPARSVPIAIEAGSATEWVTDRSGASVGAVRRGWRGLTGEVRIDVTPVGGVFRVRVSITNQTACDPGDRDLMLPAAFISTHIVLRAHGGAFVSLLDPPEPLRAVAAECRNPRWWPVLVGTPPGRETMLVSPIILYDYPAIAPESPGDLFDGGEIDELLVLNILTLTDAEKAEIRASDPRAREVLDRTSRLEPEQLRRLHGTVRELQPVERS